MNFLRYFGITLVGAGIAYLVSRDEGNGIAFLAVGIGIYAWGVIDGRRDRG